MKNDDKLILSARSAAVYRTDLSDETLELAANELDRLLYARFGERKRGGEIELPVDFRVRPEAKGFTVEVRDGGLLFTAPGAVEILYAVYDFAEEYLGYCFFEPGIDSLEEFGGKLELPAGKLIRNRRPALKRRGFVQEFPFGEDNFVIGDWMVKNKLNYVQTWMKFYDSIDADLIDFYRVRGIEIESGHHNFSYLIPAEKYHHTHPEFFAEISGRRIEPSSSKSALLLSEQLCTTNPGLREELVKNLLAYARKHPELRSVGLLPNDGFGWCECPECSKFYDKNIKGELYSLSEHVYKADRIYHDLVRYVNRRLREEGCKLTLVFCAYVNYCAPSPGMELPPQLAVSMAPYWRCINHEINDAGCPVNSHYARDIEAWCKVKAGGEVNIYEYLMGVNFYISLPMIHMKQIFDEVKYYRSVGVDGFFTQFHLPHWSVYGVNYYMMAQALYGKKYAPSMKRLMRGLFGDDAAEGERFYAKMRKLVLSAGDCHIPYPYSLFSRTRLADYEKMRDLAKALAKKLSRDEFRQDLVLWTEYLVRFKRFFDDYHAGKAGLREAQAFRRWMHDKCEGRQVLVLSKVDMYFDQIERSIAADKEWLHFGLDWEDAYIRKHHEGILS